MTEKPDGNRPQRSLLSVVVPIYNEAETWRTVLDRVAAVELPGISKQIILVDDGSTDGSRAALSEFAGRSADAIAADLPPGNRVDAVFHIRNRGKGAALRTGFAAARGELVIVQDADLEYDPAEYPRLLELLVEGRADVVYGSRFASGGRKGYRKNYLANRFLTALSNLTTGLRLTDMETCYKVFRREVLDRLDLEQDRFGIEPEITAKVAQLGVRVFEVPIRYNPRRHEAGKKIGWRDGLQAIRCIVRYGLARCSRARKDRAERTEERE